MKISYKLLKKYLNTDIALDISEVSEYLTSCGLEVDGIEEVESIKGGLKGLVIGEVLTCTDHPDSDHLHLTTVNIGEDGTPLNIVCGASNVAAGQKVVVATIGTVLYSGDEKFTIKKSKIRGQESHGMICAEDEIGLGASHDGIMVLPAEAKVGMPAAEYFGVTSDYIIEIGLTPNRSDAVSHIGVARDLAAMLQVRDGASVALCMPDVSAFKGDGDCPVSIEVLNSELCPRYTGLVLRGLKVAPSPQWLQEVLVSVGLKPINNIVDITNYVMLETGQPLHAFDLSYVKGGRVVVRTAAEGEKFVTLDGVERSLSSGSSGDLMICNDSEPMCIAGVYGGLNSGIKDTTVDLFLESAYFNASSIRKTARRHGLNTDASFRYERGADPSITDYAIKRAALLMQELAGGVASNVKDVYPVVVEPVRIALSIQYLNSLVGETFEKDCVKKVLQALEMKVENDNADRMFLETQSSRRTSVEMRERTEVRDRISNEVQRRDLRNLEISDNDILWVEVPTNKVDVTRPADLVEEFLRIYGYNKISSKGTLTFSFQHSEKISPEKEQRKIADFLAASGFYEMVNNSQINQEIANRFYEQEKIVSIANPLSSELGVMRPSMLTGGLQTISHNINRKQQDLKFFEFGRIYEKNNAVKNDAPVTARYREEEHLAIFMSGAEHPENWQHSVVKTNFYNVKRIVDMLWEKLRLNECACEVSELPADDREFAYGLQFVVNKKQIAKIGKLCSDICKAMDVAQEVYYADINWSLVLKNIPKKVVAYKEISKFPAVRRDLALLLDKKVSFAQVAMSVKRSAGNMLSGEVLLFDVYEGEHLPADKKSYAIGFNLQDSEKTLTDAQVEKAVSRIVEGLTRDCGATLR